MANCLKEPIKEIFDAAQMLSDAVDYHLTGKELLAQDLIYNANIPLIQEWTESIWGANGIYSGLVRKHRTPHTIHHELRDKKRMPSKKDEELLLMRDGFYCRFFGIPLIRKETRDFIKKIYPNALPWGKKNNERHAAFQAMWVQFDHIIPHARGGKTELENLLITCAPCNYGRMNFLLEEINLKMPDTKLIFSKNWDGLERIFKK
jgi:hypothetical protein